MRRSAILLMMAFCIATVLHLVFGVLPASSETLSNGQNFEGTPKISFEETEYDFGKLSARETVKHTFRFRNEGDAALLIHEIKTTCGCTGTLLSKDEILPGEEGEIEVTFKPGPSGGQKKRAIYVHSNDPQHPKIAIYITANIVVPVEVRPRSLNWPIDRKTPSTRTVKLLYQPNLKIEIVDLTLSSPAFKATSRATNEGGAPSYEINIRYDGALPVGNFKDQLNIVTDNSEYPQLQVAIRGKVMGAVRLSPDVITLGVIDGDQLPSRVIRIYAQGEDNFEIASVESTSPLLSTELIRDEESNGYKLKVALTEMPPQGEFFEKLLIKTNNPAANPLEVPVYAYVR